MVVGKKTNWNSNESFMYFGSLKEKARSRNENHVCIQMEYSIFFSHIFFKEGFSFPKFVR
jgi:hypothetical protein